MSDTLTAGRVNWIRSRTEVPPGAPSQGPVGTNCRFMGTMSAADAWHSLFRHRRNKVNEAVVLNVGQRLVLTRRNGLVSQSP